MFNEDSRANNITKTSAVSTTCFIANLGISFLYRTIFIYILSSVYLGINGLFTNILQILAFADLGISSSISFRLYEPISTGDVTKVGQLMNFFRKVYYVIALVILVVGIAVIPFLRFFIKETSEIPSDINLYFVYFLYLLQTISSYICVSPQMLLSADQKQYLLSIYQTVSKIVIYLVQILILILMRDFTVSLLFGIITTIVMNVVISEYVKRKYKEVFAVHTSISKAERSCIFSDTKATLCHKIGGTVLNSTDNIILSSFIGLIATGLYSNYSLIVTSLNRVLGQLFGSFTSSLGNSHFMLSADDAYRVYKRLLFADFWISGMCTVCLLNLISDFISVWLGKDMVLNQITIVAICMQFYLESIRQISTSYTFGCGLFNRDKIRPLIEATINVGVSIIMVLKIGIAGVFFGTVVSHLLTVTWREPLLLYKYEFKKPLKEYWITFAEFTIMTAFISFGIMEIKVLIHFTCSNILWWMIEAVGCMGLYNIILLIVFARNKDLWFYFEFFKKKLKKVDTLI